MSTITNFQLAENFLSCGGVPGAIMVTILPKPTLSPRERQSLASAIRMVANAVPMGCHSDIEPMGLADLEAGEHPRPLGLTMQEMARTIIAERPPADDDVRSGYETLAKLPWSQFDPSLKARAVQLFIRADAKELPVEEIQETLRAHVPRHFVQDIVLAYIELVPTFRQRSWNDR